MLEVCVDTLEDARIAASAGAGRLEICSCLEVGGLTPSPGMMSKARDLDIPLVAMIRPRAGNFIYSGAEKEQMEADILAAREAGMDGVVTGALLSSGGLDMETLTRFRSLAGNMEFALHRAFDVAGPPLEVLEQAIGIGADRILSSGGAPSVLDGMEVLASLMEAAKGKLSIMPGVGIKAANVEELLDRLHPAEIHASCKMLCPSHATGIPDVGQSLPPLRYRTDPEEVQAIVAAMKAGQT